MQRRIFPGEAVWRCETIPDTDVYTNIHKLPEMKILMRGSGGRMTGLQHEVSAMFLQEFEKQSRSHQEAVRKHRDFMVLYYKMKGGIDRTDKAKTPKVRQHLRGKQK